nr:PilZ domain-containing protein [uncultured Desulfobulbus sp.]
MEKRRFSRIALKMPAKLTIGEDIFSLKTIDNLSVGGCSLEIAGTVPIGTECRLWIPLDSTNPGLGVDVSGVVLRADEKSLGIRFDTITPESLFHLHNLIRYNAPDPDRIDEEIVTHPGLK